MMYAASARRGFLEASDSQRIDSAIDRARCYGYCASDLPLYDELGLCDAADDEMFNAKTFSNPAHLSDCNFIIRMLYKNAY